MIKEQVYVETADLFGTSVGVAHVIGFKNKREQIKEEGIESFKKIEGDLEINYIICDSIELDKYQELQREIYRIRLKGDGRLKETTIYNRAFKEIIKNENYITKRGQIF
jgi:hypothetical protein